MTKGKWEVHKKKKNDGYTAHVGNKTKRFGDRSHQTIREGLSVTQATVTPRLSGSRCNDWHFRTQTSNEEEGCVRNGNGWNGYTYNSSSNGTIVTLSCSYTTEREIWGRTGAGHAASYKKKCNISSFKYEQRKKLEAGGRLFSLVVIFERNIHHFFSCP